MINQLLQEIDKIYDTIFMEANDGFGIPIVTKNNKTLYIKKQRGISIFITKSEQINQGIDKDFNMQEIYAGVGYLNKYILDLTEKMNFFNAILKLMNYNKNIKSA